MYYYCVDENEILKYEVSFDLQKVKELQEVLSKLTSKEISEISENGLIVKLDGEDFEITSDMVLISLKQKPGYAASSNNRTCVVLDTELTEELILEGLAREFVRNVQSLRKEADFVITDHIKVYYNGTEAIDKMFDMYKDYVMSEVLGDELIKDTNLKDMVELNNEKAAIKVERV